MRHTQKQITRRYLFSQSRLHEEERGRSSSSGRSKRFRREQQSPSLDSLRRSPDSRNDHPIDGRRIQRWWWMINSFRRHNSPDSKRPNDVKCKKHEKKTAKSYVNVRNHSQLNRRVDRRSDRRDNRRNEMSFDRRDNRRDGRQELRRDNRRDDWRDNRRDDRRSSRSHDRLDDRRSNKQDSMPYSHRRHRLSQDDVSIVIIIILSISLGYFTFAYSGYKVLWEKIQAVHSSS